MVRPSIRVYTGTLEKHSKIKRAFLVRGNQERPTLKAKVVQDVRVDYKESNRDDGSQLYRGTHLPLKRTSLSGYRG